MLETEIKKLTAAVEANTKAIIGGAVAAPSAPTPAAAAPATEAPTVDIPVDVPAPAAAAEPAAEQPTLKQITEAVLALAKAKSRDVAFSLLAEYGATKVPELKGKEDQFGEIMAKINAKMAEA